MNESLEELKHMGRLHYHRDRGQYPRRDSHTAEEEAAFIEGYLEEEQRVKLEREHGRREVEC